MKKAISDISNAISCIYDKGESNAIARYVVEEISGLSYTDILVKDSKFSASDTEKIEDIIKRLIKGEPIQYILGYSYFCNLKIEVGEGVLIPRPETAELCKLIAERERGNCLRILDVCTGSGCIAFALKSILTDALIEGIDISERALDIANRNKVRLNSDVNFFRCNVLDGLERIADFYDIIVSNPPYICDFEKSKMQGNVLDFEPHSALFVEGDNPIVFYDKIATFASTNLNKNGSLYFEINPLFADDLVKMLKDKGFANIKIIEDFNYRERFIVCTKS